MTPPAQSPDSRVAALQARLDAARAEIAAAEAKRRRIDCAIESRRALISKLEAALVLARNDHAPALANDR